MCTAELSGSNQIPVGTLKSTYAFGMTFPDPENVPYISKGETHHLVPIGMHLKSLTSNFQKPIVSPFQRAPSDILAEILFCFVQLDHDSNTTFMLRSAPWIVSWVCKNWREVALSTPRIWGCIQAGLYVGKRKQMLQTQISRSRQCPLKLKLLYEGLEQQQPVLDLLMSNTLRWEDIQLQGDDRLIESLNQIESPLPQLRVFSLTKFAPGQGDLRINFTLLALRLHDIRFDNWFSDSQYLPFERLTSIFVAGSEETLFSLLGRCPNLTGARLFAFATSSLSRNPLRLQHLTSLSLSRRHCILSKLTLPSLDELIMKDMYPDHRPNAPSSASVILDFLARSSPRLTTLNLTDVSLTDSELTTILRQLPDLTKLSLDNLRTTRYEFVSAMIYHSETGAGCLVPHLKEITIPLCRDAAEFVNSRSYEPEISSPSSVAQLRRIYFKEPFYSNPVGLVESMLDAVERGVKIYGGPF